MVFLRIGPPAQCYRQVYNISTRVYGCIKLIFWRIFATGKAFSIPQGQKLAILIQYEHYTLANGLEVILHPDDSRPLVAINMLYKVGSRNDPPKRTGFAHLFEHLMFAGSENVNNFDDHLHLAGGDNNAFTSSDFTLYDDIVPAENLDTALWLESDRMKALNFSQKTLRTQQKVVVEEFKETCLEEPYGDAYHQLYELAYLRHPYRWPVIGLNFEDIAAATLEEVKAFFYQHYRPNKAILSLCGKFDVATAKEKIAYWFGDIPPGETTKEVQFPQEDPLEALRQKTIIADVPTAAIYLAFPMPGRLHPDFYPLDVLAFLLGGGRSSRLYKALVRDQECFHHLEASLSESFDPGLFVIEGRVNEEDDPHTAFTALLDAIATLSQSAISEEELHKVINNLEVRDHYSDLNLTNLGSELCIYAALGELERINTDQQTYREVSVADLLRVAKTYLQIDKRIELIYLPE